MPDIKDTEGFFLDDSIDTEGGGAWEEELVAGPNPGKRSFGDVESKIETIRLDRPQGLEAGAQIKLTTRGTEVSRVEYDARFRAALIQINREFNTPGADRFNGLVDGTIYPAGTWQDMTVDDVVRTIVSDTGGILDYDGSAPKEFAGPLTFRNTPAPQAITQALEVEGNNLWTVLGDRKTVTVIERAPSDVNVGEVGVNVVEQSLTGSDAKTDRPAMVTDRDGRGFKVQHGGPAWFGRTTPKEGAETFGAEPPLELEADLSDLLRAAQEAGLATINEAYGYTFHIRPTDRQSGWHAPRNTDGEVIAAELRLVQKGQMAGDSVTRNPPSAFLPKRYQADLITHPNRKFSFEVFASGQPSVFKDRIVPQALEQKTLDELNAIVAAAGGKITAALTDAPSERNARLVVVRSSVFEFKSKEGGLGPHVRMGIVAFYEPQWTPIDGFVDADAGEFVYEPSSLDFSALVSAFPLPPIAFAGFTHSLDHGAHKDTLGNIVPTYAITINFVEGIQAARFRAHVVTVESVLPVVSPAGGSAPFGAIESGDYEVHNVVFNAAKVPGELEPLTSPRDDRPLMQARADNLARSLTFPAMAKGSITIYPGNLGLRVGQPANGGVIAKIKHTYVPFFKTQFWLEGALDIDEPERRHFRRKIGEHEDLVQTSSARLVEADRKSARTTPAGGGVKVEPHTHGDEKSGGSKLGDVQVSSIVVEGALPDGTPAISARRGAMVGALDLKWLAGLGRLLSGDLLVEIVSVADFTATDGSVSPRATVRLFDGEANLPLIEGVKIYANGEQINDVDEAKELVGAGDIRPLFMAEDPDPSIPPTPAILVERLFMRVVDICSDTIPAFDRRKGLQITDGLRRAFLGDLLCYHDAVNEGETRLDIQAGVHFKKATILGLPTFDGPLPFREQYAAVEPAVPHDLSQPTSGQSVLGMDFLYGRLAVDRQAAEKCGAPGEWQIEVPFDICQSDTFDVWKTAVLQQINGNFAKIVQCLQSVGVVCALSEIQDPCKPGSVAAVPLPPPP